VEGGTLSASCIARADGIPRYPRLCVRHPSDTPHSSIARLWVTVRPWVDMACGVGGFVLVSPWPAIATMLVLVHVRSCPAGRGHTEAREQTGRVECGCGWGGTHGVLT
jgi:hypothetical protein